MTVTKKCKGRCDIQLGDVTQHNIGQLKKVNEIVFPVSYNEKFYSDVVAAGELAKLGSLMLKHIYKLCEQDANVQSIYLHVQTSNEDAINFYQRNGFKVMSTCMDYYKRIQPSNAYILERPTPSTDEMQALSIRDD